MTTWHEAPLTLARDRERSLHRQIYEHFQRAVASGGLRAGERVPSSRALAQQLGISRIPVLWAYEQLAAEGYFAARPGSGTRVAEAIPNAGPIRVPRGAPPVVGPTLAPWLKLRGAFRMHLPALDQFPVETWARIVARQARRASARDLAYGDALGLAALREAIARHARVARGVRCEANQVVITAGSQQGMGLAARVLLQPGDAVWMEEPGYPGARMALQAAGMKLVPVPVDEEGLAVAAGERRSPRARAVYITPSHQYPLGTTMSAGRRMELLGWAAKAGAWVLEDDYDSEYRFGERAVPALQGMDAAARVIYMGTFSKAMFPALRLGYLIVPVELVEGFAAVRDVADICPPWLAQAALAEFIAAGYFARYARRMRRLYGKRRAALDEALAECGDLFATVGERAGMHVTVLLPKGMEERGVAERAWAAGIAVMPLGHCRLRRPQHGERGGLVLGYGSTGEHELRAGVKKLARLAVA